MLNPITQSRILESQYLKEVIYDTAAKLEYLPFDLVLPNVDLNDLTDEDEAELITAIPEVYELFQQQRRY